MDGDNNNNAISISELTKERFRVKLFSHHLPVFWQYFEQDHNECVEKLLNNVSHGVHHLKTVFDVTDVTREMIQLYPHLMTSGYEPDVKMLQKMLRLSVGVSAPPITFDVIHSLVKHSLSSYENIIKANEGGVMETETDTDLIQYWNGFQSLVADLKSLGLLDTFINHSSAVAIRDKVKDYITCQCKDVYDESLLPDVIDKLQLILHDWLSSIYGEVTEDHKLKILYNIYTQYGELRIEELFDIIVEFPDSKPSLLDLKECLLHTDLRQKLMSSLKDVYKQRLLHHGANTSDIITQYISSIRALLILDPAGVILEHTCEPVRAYLRTREDTVNCIMASLIDDSNNDLAEELAKGEAMLLDLSDDIDDANQDFDNWVPDPIDADITKSSKSRRTTDIISILVYIYESQEMFVNEYRALLADRLLHSLNYDTTRELRNLELLKLRFGESSLHYCEVMIKDISDSRRVNTLIQSKLKEPNTEFNEDDIEINSFILSHVFWPSFRKEDIKMPSIIQERLDHYNRCFKEIKGMRTLEWCSNLGSVQLELEVKGQTVSFQVSPPRASVIWEFQERNSWTVNELCDALEGQPSVIRKHLLYWVGQGVLYEEPVDTFHVMVGERDQLQEETIEEDSTLSSLQDKKEEELTMVWSYVSAMLTNLGPMALDRIHTMLRMFMTQGPTGVDMSLEELKNCLDKKIKSQELIYSGGTYQLNK